MRDNLQFAVILCLFGYLIFLQQCKQAPGHSVAEHPKIDTIVQIDTTPPPPIIVQLPRQAVPKPIIIYVDSSGGQVEPGQVDRLKHEVAQLYQDSLTDENLTLYYKSTVQGKLLTNAMDYKLKVPKQITKKIEVLKPYPTPVSTLLLTGGVGGNISQFSSLRVGLNFVSAKGWSLGYDYDVLQKTHNVKLGVRLFRFESKK